MEKVLYYVASGNRIPPSQIWYTVNRGRIKPQKCCWFRKQSQSRQPALHLLRVLPYICYTYNICQLKKITIRVQFLTSYSASKMAIHNILIKKNAQKAEFRWPFSLLELRPLTQVKQKNLEHSATCVKKRL